MGQNYQDGSGSARLEKLTSRFAVPVLTRKRIWFAFAVAGIVDAVQLSLGPLGWAFVDEGLDVIAMVLICAALGFHMLLLPTFVLELVPVVDMLPTWTGCTAVVVILRKRAQTKPPVVVTQEFPRPEPPKLPESLGESGRPSADDI
jgi:hypothetical protein